MTAAAKLCSTCSPRAPQQYFFPSATELISDFSESLPMQNLAGAMSAQHLHKSDARIGSATAALGHIGPEVGFFYSVDDKTCLLAGAEQKGLAHNPWSTHQ